MFQQKYHSRRNKIAQTLYPNNLKQTDIGYSFPKFSISTNFKFPRKQSNKNKIIFPPQLSQPTTQFPQPKLANINIQTLSSYDKNTHTQRYNNQEIKRRTYKQWFLGNKNKNKTGYKYRIISNNNVNYKINDGAKSQLSIIPSFVNKQSQKCQNSKYQEQNSSFNQPHACQIQPLSNIQTSQLLKQAKLKINSTQPNLFPLKNPTNINNESIQKANLTFGFKYFTIEKPKIKNIFTTPPKDNKHINMLFTQKYKQSNLFKSIFGIDSQKSHQQLVKQQTNFDNFLTNNILVDIFYIQSFKGKRNYNQDRYSYEIKQNSNLRDKMKKFTNRINSFNQSNKQLQELKILQNNKLFSNKFYYFAVFDGHGGIKCSQYLSQNFFKYLSLNKNILDNPQLALKQTFQKIQQKFILICQKSTNIQKSGSCALVCLILNNKIYIGNVGDSRCIFLTKTSLKQITTDHKPDQKSQKLRIIRHGGKIYKDGYTDICKQKQNIMIYHHSRVLPGNLNVSRTLGDIQAKIKKYGGLPGTIISEPQIFVQHTREHDVSYLILATDGLFQGLTNQQIHDIALQNLSFNKEKRKDDQNETKIFTKIIINKAAQKSHDNITVVCLKLTQEDVKQL